MTRHVVDRGRDRLLLQVLDLTGPTGPTDLSEVLLLMEVIELLPLKEVLSQCGSLNLLDPTVVFDPTNDRRANGRGNRRAPAAWRHQPPA
jgi:hypothetical protein